MGSCSSADSGSAAPALENVDVDVTRRRVCNKRKRAPGNALAYKIHACNEPGCDRAAKHNGRCQYHICGFWGCMRPIHNGMIVCEVHGCGGSGHESHICGFRGCTRHICDGMFACEMHRCWEVGCEQVGRYGGFCIDHVAYPFECGSVAWTNGCCCLKHMLDSSE